MIDSIFKDSELFGDLRIAYIEMLCSMPSHSNFLNGGISYLGELNLSFHRSGLDLYDGNRLNLVR
jgi:hypothetical protein